ncbi:hypothetical protein Btru_067988 [Bulinus truncatus]|nr:hypothetical protein Btru_067988 [Bulinus truncatus]
MNALLEWKDKALDLQKTFYLSFSGTQWHQFDKVRDTDLLKVKICYAMFGPLTTEADTVEKAYSLDKKRKVGKILNAIFFMGQHKSGNDKRCYVDLQCRTYESWDDWKKNNVLPRLNYVYPKRGFYTCSGNSSYRFDPQRDPDLEYGNSPASSTSSLILQQTDILTSAFSLGSGIIGILTCFTPLAPAVIAAAAVGGACSATYGLARGITRLVDKGQHGESMADFESLTIWLSIAATPLHFTSSLFNAKLMAGAQQGRIFSNSTRMFATILNLTTLGVDSMMFMAGLSNFIRKAMDEKLTTLDVLQFSMSAFFFTNTLMQPKVASKIIKQA